MADHLIACVLGGTAPRARTELHDVAFAVGPSIDAVHDQLLDAWFGDPNGLHIDAWCTLDTVAGFRVELRDAPADNGLQLYFVNLGGYRPGVFGESHALGFVGADGAAEAKARAKHTLLQDCTQLHKDYLYAVDDCLPIERVGRRYIRLAADPHAEDPAINSGYFPLPAATVAVWKAQRSRDGSSRHGD